MVKRKIVVDVHYPLTEGRIVLRTDQDWDTEVEMTSAAEDGTCSRFEIELTRPFLYFKPVLRLGGELHWSQGEDFLAIESATRPVEVYPHFRADQGCSACELRELVAEGHLKKHAYRVYYPPGYAENTLRRYPVLYMQDGQNLFFRDEAFEGHHWRVAETLTLLDAMNALEPVIVVGLYPDQRLDDYTRPGYEAYGRFVVERLKPLIDAEFRTLTGPRHTAVMGSSLGGVVSFYLAWQYPEIFGMAACLSSTFGYQDNLRERVAEEPKRDVRFYLDSGWPQDNYEVTRDLRARLVRRGFREGTDMLYLAFPEAVHNEKAWAMRAHIPFQFFFGKRPAPATTAGRSSDHFLG